MCLRFVDLPELYIDEPMVIYDQACMVCSAYTIRLDNRRLRVHHLHECFRGYAGEDAIPIYD